jgi:orotate phosphoribosyltransferase
MTEERIINILKESGVLLEGHFLLTSGRHSNKYMQCAKLFQNTVYSEELCADLAEKFKDSNIDVVIGPAMGAVLMSYEVSRHLHVPNFFTERENGQMVLRRGFSLKKGMRVLIVEDVVTTGGSVREVMDIVRNDGAVVAGIGSVVDRSGGEITFGVPFKSVISMKIESWDADNCPLCKEANAKPPVKPGSRNLTK